MPFSQCQQDTKNFSLSMSLMRLRFTSRLAGIRASEHPGIKCHAIWIGPCTAASPPSSCGRERCTKLWGLEEVEQGGKRRIKGTEVSFSSCIFHYSWKVLNQTDEVISSLTWNVPPSSIMLSYFQGHTMHNQCVESGNLVPKSFKGLFDVELEIIAAVQG